jgi:hypothetical protein
MNIRNIIKVIAVLAVLFVIIQFIPYGKTHNNPQPVQEPNWDSPQTRVLVQRACFDCHSSSTKWPWYSNVAPVSWLIQHDVEEGRGVMNFTDWNAKLGHGEIRSRTGNEITNVILRNSMPPFYYVFMHPEASLSTVEKDQLIQGLKVTIGVE